MFYVYLIRSIDTPTKRYIGYTTDIEKRLAAHNSGESKHTKKFMPWEIVTYHVFKDKPMAKEFEYYLKTSSDQAFAKKRFW